jgi:hypothetical protein
MRVGAVVHDEEAGLLVGGGSEQLVVVAVLAGSVNARSVKVTCSTALPARAS